VRTKIKYLLQTSQPKNNLEVKGWIRTRRDAKGFSFLEVNDGSCLTNLQAILNWKNIDKATLAQLTTGTAISVQGDLVPSLGKGQKWELKIEKLTILGPAPASSYPLQKKRHSDEFLRTIAHLRPRTNKYGALTRIRSQLAYGIHSYLQEKGFVYVHTPILTGLDCEGAGEMFEVKAPKSDFFNRPAHLTVSGQLEAEILACALGDVYTFGPTFRAENSNTPRHAAEFWMVELEMAFANLEEDIKLAEDLVKWLVDYSWQHCSQDLELFAKFVDPELKQRLDNVTKQNFAKVSYQEAIKILQTAPKNFTYPVQYGMDLQTEHERYLSEEYFQRPVFVFNFPKEIKPFYMRLNSDQKTVAAMDLLVPRVGELIGGSQREERLEILEQRMEELGLAKDDYWWYLDLRRFGSVEHSGFGLGFERLLMFITGISNIRDVISFPRTPGQLEF